MAALERSHREILESYHGLLVKNLILTDDFFRTLVTHEVFSEHLVNDIKKLASNERASKLLDLLLTRTASGFRKFVDVLEVTGHHFLSDCLREAEHYEPIRDVDVGDMGNKLPFINKTVKTEQQRQAVRQFFREAIQKEVVKQTWKGDIHTKEQLIMARQKNIEQLWHYEEEDKIRDKSIVELQEQYLNLQSYADDLRREIKSLQKHIDDIDKKHREEIKAQVDFNMANDRTLTRLNEKAEDSGSILEGLHDILRDTMAGDYQTRQAVHEYINLQTNFEVFCTQYRELSNLVERFRDERHYLSNQVTGKSITDKADLKSAFRTFALRNEEEINNMRLEIRKLHECLSQKSEKLMELELAKRKLENGEKLGNPNMARLDSLRHELEENKLKIIHRDDKILALEKQIKILNERIHTVEAELSQSRQNEQHLKDAVTAASKTKSDTDSVIPPNITTGDRNTTQASAKLLPPSRLPSNVTSSRKSSIEVSKSRKPSIQLPTTQKRPASPTVLSPDLTSNEARSRIDSVEKLPGPPPPTQSHKIVNKARNKPTSVETSNAYLLKKGQQAVASYLMDDTAHDPVLNQKSTDHFSRAGVKDSIHFQLAPAIPAKTKSMTTYSKRLAATKAMKQNKANNTMPSTLLWMK